MCLILYRSLSQPVCHDLLVSHWISPNMSWSIFNDPKYIGKHFCHDFPKLEGIWYNFYDD